VPTGVDIGIPTDAAGVINLTELTKDAIPAVVDKVLYSVGLHLNVSPLIVEYPTDVNELIDMNIAFCSVIVDS
jgi:hypothetical protein